MQTIPLRIPVPIHREAARIGALCGRSAADVLKDAARRGLASIRAEEGIDAPPSERAA